MKKNIMIFGYYKVTQYCEGSSYISTDYEGNSKFEDYSFKEVYELQGYEILKLFSEKLNGKNIYDFTITDHKYVFDYFNQSNGSTCLLTYELEELKDL